MAELLLAVGGSSSDGLLSSTANHAKSWAACNSSMIASCSAYRCATSTALRLRLSDRRCQMHLQQATAKRRNFRSLTFRSIYCPKGQGCPHESQSDSVAIN